MLTVEFLKSNQALADLAPEKLSIIAKLSENDENTVIGTKIGEVHGSYDADVLSITGINKNNGEKSYDYVKRVLGDYKQKIEAASSERQKLNDKIKELEGNSNDEALKRDLANMKQSVEDYKNQVKELQTTNANEKIEHEKALKDVKVQFALDTAAATIKVKDSISESIKNLVLQNAKQEVLKVGTPDFVERDGKQVLVFRDANGIILTNKENNLEPFTAEEMLRNTSLKDIIETKRTVTGGNTNPPAGGGGASSVIDLSNVKSQIEADAVIESYLLQQGLTRDSAEFAQQSLELRESNEVSKLPIR